MVIRRAAFVLLQTLPYKCIKRMASTAKLSQNLTLFPTSPLKVKESKGTWLVDTAEVRPLVLLFEYMNAKKKHVDKFVEFYKDRHFDVLTVNLHPWQLFWPVRGSQVLAKEITGFLVANEKYSPIIYHGFSVGGYLWGEVLKYCQDHVKETAPMLDRIKGQIMDSGVDVNEIPTAFPSALASQSPLLKSALEKFIRYQMKTFYNESTRHYIAAREAFTVGLIRCPTLLIFSDADPFSPPKVNQVVVKELNAIDLPCHTKQFTGSKHVMHYQKHKEEYLQTVSDFLNDIKRFEDVENEKSSLKSRL